MKHKQFDPVAAEATRIRLVSLVGSPHVDVDADDQVAHLQELQTLNLDLSIWHAYGWVPEDNNEREVYLLDLPNGCKALYFYYHEFDGRKNRHSYATINGEERDLGGSYEGPMSVTRFAQALGISL